VAPADDSLEARIEAVLETRLRPQLVDRGGDVQFRGLTDGTARLQMVGSPGAVLPLRGAIERTLRRHVAEVTGIALVAADDAAEATADPAAAVQGLLETVINPALAAHGGRIELLGVEAGRVRLRFTERCQGCAMADVTLKQGIEVILRERAPGIVGVIDATDHAAGTDPYFAPRKK
jgi:Fe-S cluster biogenesis protein NfuA